MNNRLALEQNTIVDQIQKYTDTYKSDENAALKSIKFIKDETSRIGLQIYDKEKDLETQKEKFENTKLKLNLAKEKYEKYREELETI